MPNEADKESEEAMRRRKREEERRRENERRLEAQRREFERKCEALRRRNATAGEEDDATRAQNGRGDGGIRENRVGEEEEEPQSRREGAPRSDGLGRRSGKPKRRDRRATAKVETDAETKTSAGPALSAPAKNEHPELHVSTQVS